MGPRAPAGPHRPEGAGDRQRQAAGQQPRLPDRRLRLDERQPNKLPLVQAVAAAPDGEARRGGPRRDRRLCRATSGLALPSTSCSRKDEITVAAVDRLQAGGSTNGGRRAFSSPTTLATANFLPGGTNRVILCTDGDFNVGITSQPDLIKLIEQKAKSQGLPERPRVRHGEPQGRHDGAARRQGGRQLRLHRHDAGGPQGPGRADERDARSPSPRTSRFRSSSTRPRSPRTA